MNPLAAIWDIDGTLVDSEPLHLAALLQVCEAYKVDISDLPDDHFVGVNLHGVWNTLKPRYPADLSQEKWVSELNTFYMDGLSTLVGLPNAVSTIHALNELGIRQAAVSNSNRAVVDANLLAIGVTALMEFSISLDDVKRGKPDAEPYLAALSRFGVTPSQALAVEDSETGVLSAKAAGIPVFGYRNLKLSSDFHIDDLSEIQSRFSLYRRAT